jgi:hypothetical protein
MREANGSNTAVPSSEGRDRLDIAVGRALSEMARFIFLVEADQAPEAWRRYAHLPECDPDHAWEAFGGISLSTSDDAASRVLDARIFDKAFRETLLDAAGLGHDLDAFDLKAGLERFLARRGVFGFVEKFLCFYVFDWVWISIHDDVTSKAGDRRSLDSQRRIFEGLVTSSVAFVCHQMRCDCGRLSSDPSYGQTILERIHERLRVALRSHGFQSAASFGCGVTGRTSGRSYQIRPVTMAACQPPPRQGRRLIRFQRKQENLP